MGGLDISTISTRIVVASPQFFQAAVPGVPGITDGVYPGYSPAFTVTVYLFSSAQSLPGSRSSMTTVPSRPAHQD